MTCSLVVAPEQARGTNEAGSDYTMFQQPTPSSDKYEAEPASWHYRDDVVHLLAGIAGGYTSGVTILMVKEAPES